MARAEELTASRGLDEDILDHATLKSSEGLAVGGGVIAIWGGRERAVGGGNER